MGIKMKHEGNVTSRVVAANLGGQAQSSQQQATAAAQRAASENMAANKQIDGARAQAAHANTTSAADTHATPGSVAAPSGGTKSATDKSAAAEAQPKRKYLGESVYVAPHYGEISHESTPGGLQAPVGAKYWDAERGEWWREYDPGEFEMEQKQKEADIEARKQAEIAKARGDVQTQNAIDINAAANVAKERALGRTEDMSDDDFARWMQLGGDKGRAVWDISDRDRAEIDKARNDISQKRNSGELSQTEADAAMAQVDERMAGMPKSVRSRAGMPLNDPQFSNDNELMYDARTDSWVANPNSPMENWRKRQEMVMKQRATLQAQLMRPYTRKIPQENPDGDLITIDETVVPTLEEVSPIVNKAFPDVPMPGEQVASPVANPPPPNPVVTPPPQNGGTGNRDYLKQSWT